MRVTLYDLGLTEKDFKFETIDIGDVTYPNQLFNPFQPERKLTVKVNGFIFTVKTSINIELIQDLKAMTNIDGKTLIDKQLKEEAINWFINNKQYQRKLKLQKINDVQKGRYTYL